MKKSELKNIIKPLVKECINEILLQEGLLSSVISEVVAGLNTKMIHETRGPESARPSAPEEKLRLQETRKKMLDAVGRDSYGGVDLFEGTTPLRSAKQPTQGDPMANLDPRDPGVDISRTFGTQMTNNWAKIARGIR